MKALLKRYSGSIKALLLNKGSVKALLGSVKALLRLVDLECIKALLRLY